MKINEIYINPSRDEYPESYQHYFQNVNHEEQLSTGLILKVSIIDTCVHIGIFNEDKIVTYVSLHKEGEYYQIDMQCSAPEYRGQGYVRKCFEYAFYHFSPVISDVGQTTEAKQVWEALIKRPHTISYYWLNLTTDESLPIKWDPQTNTPNQNPLNDTDETVILAIPQNVSQKIQEMRLRRSQLDLCRGRDSWLGKGFTELNP